MKERREPTISSLPPDSEPERKPSRPAAQSNGTPQARAERASRPAPVSSRPTVVRSPLGPLALLVALAALGGAGYMYWLHMNTSETLSASQASLSSAEARIGELEKRLSLSDDESTQSITAVQANVKENTSEIRKLWGVAYDRNRKAIAGLEEQINALEKSLKNTGNANTQQIKDLSGELQVLKDLSQAQQTAIARVDTALTGQKESLESLLKRLNSLDASLSKRLSENEEAIRAIDAFRVQINRELIKLKGG